MEFKPLLANTRHVVGEAPHYDSSSHSIYWVDIPAGEVWAMALNDREVKRWKMDLPVSAVVPRRSGGLLVALSNRLLFLDPLTGRTDLFVAPEAHLPGNRSNETRVDPNGNLWLGTMQNNIGANGEDLPITSATGALYRVSGNGSWTRMASGVGISNTLVWDENRQRLYYGDSLTNVIWRYDWDGESNRISERRIFASTAGRGVPDGSALDQEGYLWNARWDGGCLIRYSPEGKIDRIIDLPVRRPTSCVFGGMDLRTLFVTSARLGLTDPAPLDGAVLYASAPVSGQACTRFAG